MKMMMLAAAAALALSPAAFAKGKGPKGGTPQNHHCEVGGATVSKTHKECTKAGGTWAKGMSAAAAPAAAPAPAPTK